MEKQIYTFSLQLQAIDTSRNVTCYFFAITKLHQKFSRIILKFMVSKDST